MSRRSGRIDALLPLPRLSAPPEPGAVSRTDWYRIENSADGAHIYIYDEIVPFWGTGAQDILDQIKNIDAPVLNVHINSPGGSAFEGVAIYNALMAHSAETVIHGDGLVASAASIIAQAGDKIIMHPGSMMMIHDASSGSYGNAAFHHEVADLLDKLSENIANLYSLRAGETGAYWREFMQAETWFTPTEAVDMGLADVADDKKPVGDPTPQDKWFVPFNFHGRLGAPSPDKVKISVMNRLKEKTVPDDDKNKGVANFQGVMIDNKMVTDAAAIQAHITALSSRNSVLEQAERERSVQARRDFVKNLAAATCNFGNSSGARILASQVGDDSTGYVAFALSLTEEQFVGWKATWESTPPLTLFQNHGSQNPGGAGNPGAQIDDASQDIKDKQEIVLSHKRSGMAQASIEKTASYQFLKAKNALPAGV